MCVAAKLLFAGFAMLEAGSCCAKGASNALNRGLKGSRLPRSLTFGYAFNRSLEGSRLPSSLRSWTFGYAFHWSLEGSRLPSSLWTLMSGGEFNVSREGTLTQLFSRLRSLTSSLQSVMSGCDQSLEGTQLPSSLRSLALGYAFHRSQEGSQLSSRFWTDQCCYVGAMRPCADGAFALGHAVHRRTN